jgi:hypothetical protein
MLTTGGLKLTVPGLVRMKRPLLAILVYLNDSRLPHAVANYKFRCFSMGTPHIA